jgi:putative endonuclease
MALYFTYILASHSKRLYVGMTNDLVRRLWEHRAATIGFVARYRTTQLVYFESHLNPINAIAREKQMKGWLRSKKVALIEQTNPLWEDLAAGWFDQPRSKSE